MAIRRFSTAEPGVKSNKLWDQDTQQGAMVPIATQVLNGNITSFNFGSIPQTYQDLMIIANIRSIGVGVAGAGWIINGSAGGMTYSVTALKGDGGSATSTRGSSMSYGASQGGALGSTSAPIFGTMVTHFLDYTNTTRRKSWIQRTATDSNGSGLTALEVFTNSATTAITDIACSTANGGIFWAGTATLYGIKAGA